MDIRKSLVEKYTLIMIESNDPYLGEDEQLDEISKKKLGAYIPKATSSAVEAGHSLGGKTADAAEVDRFTNRSMPDQFKTRENLKGAIGADPKSIEKVRHTISKRYAGIRRAAERLAREGVVPEHGEQIDEISKEVTHEEKKMRWMLPSGEEGKAYQQRKADELTAQNKKNDPGAAKKNLWWTVVDREKAAKKAKEHGVKIHPSQVVTNRNRKLPEEVEQIEEDWDTHHLVHKSGKLLKKGDKVKDFRGGVHVVHSIEKPRHSSSSGRVTTNHGEFFPGVIDAKIVPKPPEEKDFLTKAFAVQNAHALTSRRMRKIGEAVEVHTGHYEFAHGKKPRDYGTWMFSPHKNIDFGKHKEGEHFISVNGKYGEAKKKAQQWAASKGHRQIRVHEGFEGLQEVAYSVQDHKKPVIVSGVKGMKSRPFKKKFPTHGHFERWHDSEKSDDHEVHHVYQEEVDHDLQEGATRGIKTTESLGEAGLESYERVGVVDKILEARKKSYKNENGKTATGSKANKIEMDPVIDVMKGRKI